MKTFLISATISLIFLGCSHNNAFDLFEMSQERERSEESIQSSKIMLEGEIIGVATAVYLNRIYPDLYKDAEYFYIYLNIEASAEETEFRLDAQPSLYVEELNSSNPYTKLTDFDADWKRYYLVGFQERAGQIKLRISNKNAATSEISFKKE